MDLIPVVMEKNRPEWLAHWPRAKPLLLAEVDLAAISAEANLEQYLTREEQEQLARFALAKRRTEWLGGRLAAKAAVAEGLGLCSEQWREIAIAAAENGRPFAGLPSLGRSAPDISISHSGHAAMAMAASVACGLDVQQISKNIVRIARRFATAEEEEMLPTALEPTNRLTLLWSGKEAIRKMVAVHPLLGFLEMKLQNLAGSGTKSAPFVLDFHCARPGTFSDMLRVLAFSRDDYMVALVCQPAQTAE